jgi:hypothetical protein
MDWEHYWEEMKTEEVRWGLIGAASALVAGVALRQAIKLGWRMYYDKEPPHNPYALDVTWKEALLWSGTTGLAVGLARMIGRRGAAGAYRRITGHHPPI